MTFLEDRYRVQKGGGIEACDNHCKNTVRYIHICTINFLK